ncbi:MAG TPA: GNAT family N-acetyltransferase [Candidatus Dormibacteraeota bacterium]|nr:GNAT family N-acetyltransferase [Candidatus Dormibacteraeota bacterium]
MEPFTSPLKLRVSIAKDSDRPVISRLCRRAVGRSDYVLRILPSIIARGALFLAWDVNALVGITNFDKCIDESGWLSVARTDPDWRGRGVATFLQNKIAAYAREQGVGTLRLWASAGNRSSLRACERGGFRQVCEVAHVSRNLRTSKPQRRVSPSSPSEAQLLPLLKSSYVAKTKGYMGYRRHFLKLTKQLLTKLRDEGELYLIGDATLLVSRPEITFGAPQSSLAILDGPLGNSLGVGKEIARGMGARILRCYIPYRSYEISVAKRLGFRRTPWGKHCLVFEKKVRRSWLAE